jgi:hypothetical protein
MLGSAGAGLDRGRAQRRGPALRHDDAINSGSIGNAQEGSEILGIFHTVERQQESRLRRIGRFEEIFDVEPFFRPHKGDDSLVSCGAGKLREVLARFRADADAGVLALGYETGDAIVMTLGCNQHVIEAPSPGFQRLGYRMDAVENFHLSSLDGAGEAIPDP